MILSDCLCLQLETALANERRRVTSSAESDDYTRTRSPRRRRIAKGKRSDGSASTHTKSCTHKEEPSLPVRQSRFDPPRGIHQVP